MSTLIIIAGIVIILAAVYFAARDAKTQEEDFGSVPVNTPAPVETPKPAAKKVAKKTAKKVK